MIIVQISSQNKKIRKPILNANLYANWTESSSSNSSKSSTNQDFQKLQNTEKSKNYIVMGKIATNSRLYYCFRTCVIGIDSIATNTWYAVWIWCLLILDFLLLFVNVPFYFSLPRLSNLLTTYWITFVLSFLGIENKCNKHK